jgi:DNA-binding transcriptional LysR family regulator
MNTFALETDEALLLLELEKSDSIAQVAKAFRRDPSVISRALKSLSLKLPVIEKIQGKWVVTELGKNFNNWSAQAILSQQNILNQKTEIRIGSTREFASRFLIGDLEEIFPTEKYNISVVTFDKDSESLLLNGLVDFVFDCGKPFDPQISFRRPTLEKMALIISKEYKKSYKLKAATQLSALPHIHYSRNNLSRLNSTTSDQLNVVLTVNDIALVREAVRLSLGWGLVPTYTVKKGLENKELLELPQAGSWTQNPYQFGVWWNRDKTHLAEHIPIIEDWLKSLELN